MGGRERGTAAYLYAAAVPGQGLCDQVTARPYTGLESVDAAVPEPAQGEGVRQVLFDVPAGAVEHQRVRAEDDGDAGECTVQWNDELPEHAAAQYVVAGPYEGHAEHSQRVSGDEGVGYLD